VSDRPQPDSTEGNAAEVVSLEAGRRLFAQPCRFVAAAASVAQIPAATLPEVAFAGRSNVGKSSLVNALTGRRTLARTSHSPGRTRQVNFFDLAGALMLVDLPGYGYAAASKAQIGNWTRLVDAYLTGRASLRRVLLLIDARHGPKPIDRRVMTMLDRAAVVYQAVLTKADKAGQAASEAAAAIAAIAAEHTALHPEVITTSALSGEGIARLREQLAQLANWQSEEEGKTATPAAG
jgi:GTP-binding protein